MSRPLRELITEMPGMIRVAHNFTHGVGARRSSIKTAGDEYGFPMTSSSQGNGLCGCLLNAREREGQI